MVHATVKRESDKSFTVTFDDVTTLNNQKAVPAAASGTASAAASGTASKPVSAASSETGSRLVEAEKALDKAVEAAKKAAQTADANASANKNSTVERAKKIARTLTSTLTEVHRAIDATNMTGNEKAVKKSAAKSKKDDAQKGIGLVFAAAKKGGRRTYRKRSHRKRTHRKRT